MRISASSAVRAGGAGGRACPFRPLLPAPTAAQAQKISQNIDFARFFRTAGVKLFRAKARANLSPSVARANRDGSQLTTHNPRGAEPRGAERHQPREIIFPHTILLDFVIIWCYNFLVVRFPNIFLKLFLRTNKGKTAVSTANTHNGIYQTENLGSPPSGFIIS